MYDVSRTFGLGLVSHQLTCNTHLYALYLPILNLRVFESTLMSCRNLKGYLDIIRTFSNKIVKKCQTFRNINSFFIAFLNMRIKIK